MPSNDKEHINYFAIGSMMNPISLKARQLHPVESYPAEILDYELLFLGKMAMAFAMPTPGKSFHGVLHKMTEADMKVLDGIEITYERIAAVAKLYDGSTVSCTVYSSGVLFNNGTGGHHSENALPGERYIDIMTQGCKHFGVKQEYIDWLQSLEVRPRTDPSEFKKLVIPEDCPLWTMKDVLIGDGKDERPLYATVNGKVVENFGVKKDSPYYDILVTKVNMQKEGQKSLEVLWATILYEPNYGVPSQDDRDYSQGHRDYIENLLCTGNIVWKVIAYLSDK